MYAPVRTESDPMLASPTSGKAPRVAVSPQRLDARAPQCHDGVFAALFLINVGLVGAVALFKGVPVLLEDVDKNQDTGAAASTEAHHVTEAASMIGLLCVLGLGLSVAWLQLLLTHAASMIRLALWLNVAMTLCMALSMAAVNLWAALGLVVVAALHVWYMYAVQNRIGFASANLKTACAALQRHAAVFALALGLVLQQLAWLLWCGVAGVGLHQWFRELDPACDQEVHLARSGRSHGGLCVGLPAYAALFYLLVTVYWGQQVLQNVLTCTTAGVTATWWYQPEAARATTSALCRSLTTSFGSICFGSLIVAVLQALRTMADMAKRRASDENNGGLACLACMAECILSCLAGVMEYINQWAYVYVGVYGYPFRASGKAVMDLFHTRGWTAIINDDLTSSALSFGALGVGIVTGCVGLLMVRFSPVEWFTALGSSTSAYATMAVVGFIVGISVAMTLAHVVIAALHTVFVCFAEDPVALNRNHPEEYQGLVAGWRQFHGSALVSAYGGAV